MVAPRAPRNATRREYTRYLVHITRSRTLSRSNQNTPCKCDNNSIMVSDERTDGRCNSKAGPDKNGYCESYPVDGETSCRMHLGKSVDGGSHEDNQNASTHGLFSAHDNYYQDLDDDEQSWVFDFTNSLLDRFRRHHGKEPDHFDKEALKNIAIDFHRIAHANGWFAEHGLIHREVDASGDMPTEEKKINVWAAELRQYNESIYNRMQKHGLLDDPESQKANSLSDLTVDIERTRVTEDNIDEFGE